MAVKNIFETMSDDELDLFNVVSSRCFNVVSSRSLESVIKDEIKSLLAKGYKKTESFHSIILLYAQEIESNYNSVEDKRQLAITLGYTKSMGQEIQKMLNVGKIINENKYCDVGLNTIAKKSS